MKRSSSLVLGAYFLELNGYDFAITKFVLKMENIVVWLAENKISKELLAEIIRSLIYDEDYPESLKLNIAKAVWIDTE